MVSMVTVAMPCMSTVACVSTVCFMTGVVLAFVPMAFMVVPFVAAVMTVVIVVTAVIMVRMVVGRLMRSCWGLTHTAFSWRAGGAGVRGRRVPEGVIFGDTPNGRMAR